MFKRSTVIVSVLALCWASIATGSSQAVSVRPGTKIVKVTKFVGHIFFDSGSAVLTPTSKAFLRKAAQTHAKAAWLSAVGYVQQSGVSANDLSLSSARARSVADFLGDIGYEPDVTTSARGVHPSLTSSPLARRVSLYAAYQVGDVESGSGSSGTSKCGNTPAVFLVHALFSGQSSTLSGAAQAAMDSALRRSTGASVYGSIGYVPQSSATTATVMLARNRAIAVASYMRQQGVKSPINVYSRSVDLGSTNPLANRVSVYVSYPVAPRADGTCPPANQGGTSAPANLTLSGTFDAISYFTNDDIYMTGARITGPLNKSLTTPADDTDNDNKQFWKFTQLKPGTYQVTIRMHVKDTGGCLSLFAKNGDNTVTYGGVAGGWTIDPTDEYCEIDSDFEVFKNINVIKNTYGQDFTFGFADCFNQDGICFGVDG